MNCVSSWRSGSARPPPRENCMTRVRIQYGLASELRIAPEDPRVFLADIANHTPHLIKRGYKLVAALA